MKVKPTLDLNHLYDLFEALVLDFGVGKALAASFGRYSYTTAAFPQLYVPRVARSGAVCVFSAFRLKSSIDETSVVASSFGCR